ncbi:DNA recombination and repair protein Rad51, C-terminal [Artemisia annua]|uniref:DNA recombination and repair protein Rad51, C-terminal n=1 Tax=Artemisia annua TaxID=35608 RepID=A0A2U1QDL7_ARTAN|nr:DNA recombination and repair protein Rad51, C-terminal [Artemisia annua]
MYVTWVIWPTWVKVVIVDSITFHFRQGFDDMASRTRVLGGMALKLMKLARKFGVRWFISICLCIPTLWVARMSQ